MNELKNILEQNLNDNFISAVLSNPRDEKLSAKVKVRPVLMKDTRVYQMETFRGNQAFHENLSADEACEKMLEAMENMKQMQLVTADAEFSVLISKKGKVTIKKKQKKAKMRPLDLNHNRKKQYILQEGVPVPFFTGSWCYDGGRKDCACKVRQVPADQPVPGIYRGYFTTV